MKIIIFEEETYYKMLEELKKVVKEATAPPTQKEWLSAEEAKELLGNISKSKLQKLRDYGEIVISQHERMIRYSRSSILLFLEKHRVRF
jgi:hypothetical protein